MLDYVHIVKIYSNMTSISFTTFIMYPEIRVTYLPQKYYMYVNANV